MGLSEEDKKNIPYFREQALEKEKKRWEKFMKSPESTKITEMYQRAIEDNLHQLILADFHAKELKATVEQVVSATSYWMTRLCDSLIKSKFYLTEKMLERFDLVKKEKK